MSRSLLSLNFDLAFIAHVDELVDGPFNQAEVYILTLSVLLNLAQDTSS